MTYLTLKKLLKLTPEELERVQVITRKDGNPRGEDVGVFELTYEKSDQRGQYRVELEMQDGDPTIQVGMNEPIHLSADLSNGAFEYTMVLLPPKPKRKR